MQNRIFPLVLATIIGIVLGVAFVNKQAKDPVLKEILNQQQMLISNQKVLEGKLGGNGPEGGSTTLQQLDSRLNSLESEWKGFKVAFQKFGGEAGGGRGQANDNQGPPPEDFDTVHTINIDHTPVMGKKDAPVMIVEFMDYQCPFCNRFHPPMVEVAKAFPGKVSYMIKNFPLPFHPQARPAAKAAFAAGEQGKYFEMSELLLQNFQTLSEDKYKEFAKQLKLDESKFWSDYKDKDAQWEKYIKADMQLAQQVGVQGTPTYYINGRKTMARDFETYKKEIEAILNGK